DQETARWSLAGQAADFRISKERQEVLDMMRKAGAPLTPSKLAPLLEKKVNTVKKMLWDMAAAGQVTSLGDGHYVPSSGVRSNPSNSSTSSNRSNPSNPAVTGGYRSDLYDGNPDPFPDE